jgi:CRISPR-associated protein Cst1
MKKNYSTIDYEWLTKPTGDPFADAGGYVIKYLSEKYPEKDILEIIEHIAEIYVNRWESKINSFFLNSAITQPAFKGDVKIKETLRYFSSLIHETHPSESGYCRITGIQTKLFKAGRDNSLLSGSGTFVNFHHNLQAGIMISKEMIIRMFFIPYGAILIGGRIAVIHSNDTNVNEYFVIENCKANDDSIAMNSSEGILNSAYNIPANALFHFVDDIFTNIDLIKRDSEKDLSITLYHFTNFGANPEIVLYRLPTNVFRFYSTCLSSKIRKDWQPFLSAHYTNSKYKGAIYNKKTSNYEYIKKKGTEHINFDDYKIWRNVVLENLLHNKSLLGLFLKWSATHKFNFNIIELYQKEIQYMKPETLNKIKELAKFLTEAEDDVIKKIIKSLDGFKSAYDLRRFFLKSAVAKNYNSGAKNTIITLEEMVYYLFPDDVSWRDIRTLLMIAIYQELHERKKFVEIELNNETNEESE